VTLRNLKKKRKKHQLCSAVDIISPTDKVALSREKKGGFGILAPVSK